MEFNVTFKNKRFDGCEEVRDPLELGIPSQITVNLDNHGSISLPNLCKMLNIDFPVYEGDNCRKDYWNYTKKLINRIRTVINSDDSQDSESNKRDEYNLRSKDNVNERRDINNERRDTNNERRDIRQEVDDYRREKQQDDYTFFPSQKLKGEYKVVQNYNTSSKCSSKYSSSPPRSFNSNSPPSSKDSTIDRILNKINKNTSLSHHVPSDFASLVCVFLTTQSPGSLEGKLISHVSRQIMNGLSGYTPKEKDTFLLNADQVVSEIAILKDFKLNKKKDRFDMYVPENISYSNITVDFARKIYLANKVPLDNATTFEGAVTILINQDKTLKGSFNSLVRETVAAMKNYNIF